MDQLSVSFVSSTSVRHYLVAGLLLIFVLSILIIFVLYRKSLARITMYEVTIGESNNMLNAYENTISRLSAQNDWLFTEMHHRIKNNLQITNSLINSQLSYVTDPAGREALTNIRHRLFAQALVHQKLFQTSMVSELQVPGYIVELTDYLLDEYGGKSHIKVEYDMVPLVLDISLALPLALIMNELLSNTFKFAFPDERNGKIIIQLITKDDLHCELTVIDDGVGMPDNFDFGSGRSLGGSLITGLASQMKAELTIKCRSGTQVSISFDFAKPGNKKDNTIASKLKI